MITRRVFISHDSLSNNVHVWFIADRLWSGNGIPFSMPVLADGDALTFPYASIPWATAALFWPILGDRVVTLWLVLGFLGIVAATFWSFPILRRGWWAAATLTNPALVISPLLGQLPFLWAMASLTFAVGLWRRGRTAWAVVFTAAAQVVHPPVMMPVVAAIVVLYLPFERAGRRLKLVGWWALTVLISLPAAWAVMQSPVVSQTSRSTQLRALLETSGMRLLVLLGAILLALLAHWRRTPLWTPAVLVALFVFAQYWMYQPFGMDFAWGALTRDPDPAIEEFATSGGVIDGQTYRVLSGRDGKYGLYAVVREGGVLDAEFFPEGLHRGPFRSPASYARFLHERGVNDVVLFPSYAESYTRTNEPQMLEELDGAGCIEGIEVSSASQSGDWKLYDVDRSC